MRKLPLLLALFISMSMFAPPASAACWPWNKCFYNDASAFFKQMADSATSIGNAAMRGDIDGVASGVISNLANAGAFSDVMFSKITDIAPGQVGQYVRVAGDIRNRIEREANGMRAQAYQNLYRTFKNDATVLTNKLKDRDFDFSEYYRYNFYYAVATSDWSNPTAMKASAKRIAEDQYAAYSWYQAHTWKGAAIGTVRNRVGLTDDAIINGVSGLAKEIKANKDLGTMGAVILAHFASVASAARNDVLGTTRSACAQVFGDSSNIEYCVQRCLPGFGSTDAMTNCARSTPPIINACRGMYTDPANQEVCLTRCTHAKTQQDIDFCSKAAAPIINACRGTYTDPGNQAVCIKRCFSDGDANCVKNSATVINACANLFTAQTNINYCKDHCAQAPIAEVDRCRRHAAEMINTGRREPYVSLVDPLRPD